MQNVGNFLKTRIKITKIIVDLKVIFFELRFKFNVDEFLNFSLKIGKNQRIKFTNKAKF